jgi:cation transport ATPase
MSSASHEEPALREVVLDVRGMHCNHCAASIERAWRAARNRSTNMDTSVALGSSVAFFYRLAVLLLGLDPMSCPVYFESAAMIIPLVMVGKFLESRARRDAGDAVRALVARQPDRAWLLRDGERSLDCEGSASRSRC